MKEKYCISLDWLQVYMLRPLYDLPLTLETLYGTMDVKRQDYSTNLWSEVYIIERMGKEVATFCRCPKSPKMERMGCTLKLANRVLYSHEWYPMLNELIKELKADYKGITRIDVCYDCNRLKCGRSVPEFLMQYFSHAPYCEGHIIRSGSRKVTINATRSNAGGVEISAMRWGSKGSDIGAYCYNKTLELMEVKDKPWIRETWEVNGLVSEIDNEGWNNLHPKEKERAIEFGDTSSKIKQAVWRFEISIKSHGKDILDMSSGELFRLQLDYLSTQSAIEHLFYVYASKVFDFRMSTGQTRIRNYPPLEIFEDEQQVSERPVHISNLADTGRTEKIVANKLQQLSEQYSDIAGSDKTALEAALAFIRAIAGAKAGIVRMRKELDYLSYMKGYERKEKPVVDYLDFIDFCHNEKRKIDATTSYDFWTSLVKAVEDDALRSAKSGYTSDMSPVW